VPILEKGLYSYDHHLYSLKIDVLKDMGKQFKMMRTELAVSSKNKDKFVTVSELEMKERFQKFAGPLLYFLEKIDNYLYRTPGTYVTGKLRNQAFRGMPRQCP
jgi:hypothetical protein